MTKKDAKKILKAYNFIANACMDMQELDRQMSMITAPRALVDEATQVKKYLNEIIQLQNRHMKLFWDAKGMLL